MQLFKIDGPLYRILDRLMNLLILNILFIVCCLPIFTIGPALTALYYVNMKIQRDEESGIVQSFFRSFLANFKQASGIGIGMLFLAVLLIFDIYVLTSVLNISAELAQFLTLIAISLLAILALVSIYFFAALAQFDNKTSALLKWSAFLVIRHLPVTVISAVLAASPALVLIFLPEIFIQVGIPLMALIGFSGISFLQSFFYVRVFTLYMPKDSEE